MESNAYETTVFAVTDDGTILSSETVHFTSDDTCQIIMSRLIAKQMFDPEKHSLLLNGEVLHGNKPISELKIDEATFFLVKQDKMAGKPKVTVRSNPRKLYPIASLDAFL